MLYQKSSTLTYDSTTLHCYRMWFMTLTGDECKLWTSIPVVITAKNDSYDVLADVVDVSFHCRDHQRSNVCTVLSEIPVSTLLITKTASVLFYSHCWTSVILTWRHLHQQQVTVLCARSEWVCRGLTSYSTHNGCCLVEGRGCCVVWVSELVELKFQ